MKGRAGSGLNWTAVSALSTALAAVVALAAYLGTMGDDTQGPTQAPPSQSPEPVITSHTLPPAKPTTRSPTPPPPEPTTPPPPVERTTPASLPPVHPQGCDEAAAALTAYSRNAGSTRSGQAAAAQQAYSDLMGAGLHAQGAVAAKIRRLAAEFQELGFRLTGMTGGDPNQVIADINTDVAEFNTLCGYA